MRNQSGIKVLLLLAAVLASVACPGCSSTHQKQMVAAKKSSEPLEFTIAAPEPPKEPGPKLMVYGGRKHDVYLGCLNCKADEPESVFNEFGSYGSPYSPYSLWNAGTAYGSAGSPMSPLNPRATNPPVIKDQHGKFHGYLSVNKNMPQVFRSREAEQLLRLIQGS